MLPLFPKTSQNLITICLGTFLDCLVCILNMLDATTFWCVSATLMVNFWCVSYTCNVSWCSSSFIQFWIVSHGILFIDRFMPILSCFQLSCQKDKTTLPVTFEAFKPCGFHVKSNSKFHIKSRPPHRKDVGETR